jgi:RNA polymerase sigma-70 factor (ECF subfamily)
MLDVATLFKQYYPRLRNYAFRMLGDGAVADDIVQECFVKLYEKRFTLKDVSPGALLFVMVRNSSFNYLKRRAAIEEGRPAPVLTARTPEDDLMFAELRVEIDKVMTTLPLKCREVFRMSRLEGLNTREIAERIGTSTQNVEKHIAKALNVFARHFAGLDISMAGIS